MKPQNSKWIKIKKDQVCYDCGRRFAPGANMKVYVGSKSHEEYDEFKRTYLCYDCEKYYRREDPKMEF